MHGFKKGAEPRALLEWKHRKVEQEQRELAEVAWDELDIAAKQGLREALLLSQGALCAYCGARIRSTTIRIDHWSAQRDHPGLRFEWSNLLGVCDGDDGLERHCDNARGPAPLVYKPDRDPVHEVFVFRDRRAASGGRENWIDFAADDREATDIEVLNLNAQRLRRNRRAALDAVENGLQRRFPNRTVPQVELDRLMAWKEELRPYFQVIRPFLQRLRRKAL